MERTRESEGERVALRVAEERQKAAVECTVNRPSSRRSRGVLTGSVSPEIWTRIYIYREGGNFQTAPRMPKGQKAYHEVYFTTIQIMQRDAGALCKSSTTPTFGPPAERCHHGTSRSPAG